MFFHTPAAENFPAHVGRSFLTLFCSSDGMDVYFGVFLTSDTYVL